jgi:cytochrome P450
MIAWRRKTPPEGDLVDMLMKARDPQTDAALSDSLLADNLLGFIIAGHETTASTLTWALFLLAAHPPTLQRVREEVAAVAGNEPIGPAHVGQLVFVRRVVSETMRLFPAGFLLTRVAQRATTLAGRRVAAGQRVNVPVYAIHRRPGVFPDPHAFQPDRFAPDRPAPDRFAYLPFGAGPRICIGSAFASAEMVTVLATLVRRVDFTPPPVDTVWPVAQLGLTPRNGMPMQVRARSI